MKQYFILSATEDGTYVEGPMDAAEVHKWISERTEDIKPEYHPVFKSAVPRDLWELAPNGAVLIEGSITVPKPVAVVTEYDLG